ncbi:MAG: hypothetical protein AAF727_06160 [Pseudomonadota bacterium]
MIIVPEIETVIITPPRTGSGTLHRVISATYPTAIRLYRHMEADGVPAGYDRWQKVGLVRNPIDRLWSLFKFLQRFSGTQHDPAFVADVRGSVDRPFSDWVVHNQTVFTSPYDRAGTERFFPFYTVRHALPENHKSQFHYLRPDLGTSIFQFSELGKFAQLVGIDLDLHENASDQRDHCYISPEAMEHMQRLFRWDFIYGGPSVSNYTLGTAA